MSRVFQSLQAGTSRAGYLCRARQLNRSAFGLVVLSFAAAHAGAVTIDWVSIGDPGNLGELSGESAGGDGPDAIVGAVAYKYRIAKHEVTNNQYVEFLNAKDPTGANALELYNGSMSSDARGGITYTAGNPDGSKYGVKTGRGVQPVVYVNWYDSIRFANWLNNGQGNGSTETGAYRLLGGTAIPSNGLSITRLANAKVFLPSEDEWYKAAYYDGSSAYVDYPTGTDLEPNADDPPGAAAIQANVGNFYRDDGPANGYNDGFAVTGSNRYNQFLNYLTDVGAYTASLSLYGTFDQGGNVWERNEALISGSSRGLRGGSWSNTTNGLLASVRAYDNPASEYDNVGFRVASIPEPSTAVLSMLACVLFWMLRERKAGRTPWALPEVGACPAYPRQ